MSAATDLEVTSDAAGAIGFGAYSQGQWFYGAWSKVQARQSIAYQELFPVSCFFVGQEACPFFAQIMRL